MKWSKYQQDIFNFVKNEKGNAVINAVAGSGKTTSILEALKYIPKGKKTIFLAFNKSIVNELKSRVPEDVEVSTLHSFGLRSIRFKFQGRKLVIDNKKIWSHLQIVSRKWDECADLDKDESYKYLTRIKKMISLTKLNLLNTIEEINTMADRHGFNIEAKESERVMEVIAATNQRPHIVDFDDMVYTPAHRDDFNMLKYDFVFVDECQDLNKAQQTMMKKIIKPVTGRFVAVGDPSQAIYGFAGADAESYNRLRDSAKTIELPLSVSYRCGKSIIAKAQEIVPQIMPFEGSPDGVVREGRVNEIEDGDMVLCRNKKPLISLTLDFLARGVKAYMMGKSDIGTMLINLVKKAKADSLADLHQSLKTTKDKFVEMKVNTTDMDKSQVVKTMGYANLADKCECITVIADDNSVRTPNDVITKIDKIFDESNEGIILSTIHKAKGLESDNIFALRADLVPSKYALQPWQQVQERNLQYVMITRAKSKLVYLTDERYSDVRDEDETLIEN
jgi:DNA helicase-2/ATP-dependent DNA helicase PcrA